MKHALESNRPLNGPVLIDDPFWNPKLRTFFDITLPDSFDKLEKDGAIENYENLIAGNLNTHKACPWHDGLLLETIRGASDYLLRGENSPSLVERIDRYAEIIERAQLVSGGGYLSTYTQLDRPISATAKTAAVSSGSMICITTAVCSRRAYTTIERPEKCGCSNAPCAAQTICAPPSANRRKSGSFPVTNCRNMR